MGESDSTGKKKYPNYLKVEGDLKGRHCGDYDSMDFSNAFGHKNHTCESCNAPVVDPKGEQCLRDVCFEGKRCEYDNRVFC